MSEDNNNVEVLTDGMNFEAPDHAWQILRRVWHSVNDQYKRLTLVFVSVVLCTFLSTIAPLYSAHTVDLLWNNTKEIATTGTTFQVTWAAGGRDMVFLLLIYLAAALFCALQSFLVSNLVERLSPWLRAEINEKLSRLPLFFFDRTKTREILSRIVDDLDKTSEALRTGMLELFIAVGMIIDSLIMMLRFSILLTLAFLVLTGTALVVANFVSAKALKSALKWQQRMSNVTV